MPNIEIHGVTEDDKENIRDKIFRKTEGLVFASEVVVTKVLDDCRDRDGKSQPFLRIVTSEAVKIKPLVQALDSLNMDIEVPNMAGFIPGKKH